MNNKIIIILSGVIVLLIMAGGGVLYVQQRQISKLQSILSPASPQAITLSTDQLNKLKDEQFQNLTISETYLTGQIAGISGNRITLNAQVSDLSTLKGKDLAQAQEVSLISKTYTVNVDNNTTFAKTSLSKLKVDDMITVVSGEPVYGKSEVTAVSIDLVAVPAGTTSVGTVTTPQAKRPPFPLKK